jgi:hypothetical protein
MAERQTLADSIHRRDCESVPDLLYPDRETGACDCGEPEAVIADCDAMLAIINLMDETLKYAQGDTEVDHYGALSAAEETLSRLAQPFAGHPDHKGEEWTP